MLHLRGAEGAKFRVSLQCHAACSMMLLGGAVSSGLNRLNRLNRSRIRHHHCWKALESFGMASYIGMSRCHDIVMVLCCYLLVFSDLVVT